jgi:hypothetical protein
MRRTEKFLALLDYAAELNRRSARSACNFSSPSQGTYWAIKRVAKNGKATTHKPNEEITMAAIFLCLIANVIPQANRKNPNTIVVRAMGFTISVS